MGCSENELQKDRKSVGQEAEGRGEVSDAAFWVVTTKRVLLSLGASDYPA